MEATGGKTIPSPPKLEPLTRTCGAAVMTQHGEVQGSIHEEEKTTQDPEPRLQLDSDAHRRWKTSISVEFLKTVSRIDIETTRYNGKGVVLYELEDHQNQTSLQQATLKPNSKAATSCEASSSSYMLERSFSDFEELREKVIGATSILPVCSCQYCVDFVLYIRYKFNQPRNLIKLTTGTEKRKQILTTTLW